MWLSTKVQWIKDWIATYIPDRQIQAIQETKWEDFIQNDEPLLMKWYYITLWLIIENRLTSDKYLFNN
jgi:hypothetical protein